MEFAIEHPRKYLARHADSLRRRRRRSELDSDGFRELVALSPQLLGVRLQQMGFINKALTAADLKAEWTPQNNIRVWYKGELLYARFRFPKSFRPEDRAVERGD